MSEGFHSQTQRARLGFQKDQGANLVLFATFTAIEWWWFKSLRLLTRKLSLAKTKRVRKHNQVLVMSIVLVGMFVMSQPSFAQDFFVLVAHGSAEQVKAAIEGGASLKDRNKDDATPLMVAAAYNQMPDVISVLVKAGAEIEERNKNGATPLMFAALYNKNPDVVSALLDAGAKIDDQNNEGGTPLIFAAAYNQNPEVISVLLKAGANGKLKSKDGKTAYDYAQKNNNLNMTKTLQDLEKAQY